MRKIFTLIIVLLSVAAVYASELADSATCVKNRGNRWVWCLVAAVRKALLMPV